MVPYKYHKHQSIYLDEKLDKRISDAAVSEKKSKNKMINELIRIGLSKRDEDIFGLESIAKTMKADLQLTRDEIRKQSNRIATVLLRVGLHAIAGRYQTTYAHAKITDSETARKVSDLCWKYAIEKIKEKTDSEDDSKE
jgi:hypothetical protein